MSSPLRIAVTAGRRQATLGLVDITEVAQEDESALRDYWSVEIAAHRVDVPILPLHPFEELANERADERDVRRRRWLARDGDRPVGIAYLVLPALDNTEAAGLNVVVHPAERRRGIGRQLLATAIDRMRAEGRTHAVGDAAEPLDGAVTSGSAFAAAMGADRALEEICRVLELDAVGDAQLIAVQQEATTYAAGYELVQWAGPCSDDDIDDLAVLTGRMTTDAPLGDIDWEAEAWDRDRVRQAEERTMRLGRTWVTTAARDLDSGHLVAYSDIGRSLDQAGAAFQWMTIVAPEHRGRRLGLLVKAANLQLVRREMPGVGRIITWNAESNAHMIAINDRLGFTPCLRFCQWQLTLSP